MLEGKLLKEIAEITACRADDLKLTPVGGGDCNETWKLDAGQFSFFLKINRSMQDGFFQAEAEGLAALAAVSEGPRVPLVKGTAEVEGTGILVLEYIEPGRSSEALMERLGRELAGLHLNGTSELYGFAHDNFIGLTPQVNTETADWRDFYLTCRIEPQVHAAVRSGYMGRSGRKKLESLMKALPSLLRIPEHPSLLHGDLWGGNFLAAAGHEPVLIDPAVYYGDREADIAMTELFGGFPAAFYRGYDSVFPLDPGYRFRRDLYNLYHLLNHLNMFGGGYLHSVMSITDAYLRN